MVKDTDRLKGLSSGWPRRDFDVNGSLQSGRISELAGAETCRIFGRQRKA
jgi:hypothetical protein